ncbi:class I adenylate-forming enzyme family protein [Rhodococcus koreensis]|uniref:class I adenylate-forming enzyme family protein n=1 Tax=Rhodococcus koreensis TaxID=99653 RepID=UPI00197E9026|nr:AMP-binding protein [Rhodococcus koreensis]QSE77798.1 AMP-binding protein [Rhodococcus koreensis]
MSDLHAAALPSVGPGQILPFAATRHPDKIGLVVGDRRLTYRELDHLSDGVAASLRARNIGPGDVVSLYGQNSAEWIVSYHGALKAGAVVNPVNVMLTGPELSYVLSDCGAKAVFAGSAQADTVEGALQAVTSVELFCVFDGPSGAHENAVPWAEFLDSASDTSTTPTPKVTPKDLCCIGYTSGTTGNPKGAMQTHQAVLLNCALTATMHGRLDDDIVVTALPAAHVYGNVAINSTFLAGGTVVLMDRFNAAHALRLIGTESATMFEGVPAMYSMIMADPSFETAELSSLRKSTIGGQTFSPSLAERWQARVAGPVLELWGMTEISGLGTTHSVYTPPVPGSIGVSLPGIEIKIGPIDGSLSEVPVGTPGELMVRGPLVMLGYYGRPDATAEVLSPDGWLRTGDVAYVDDTGHFFVVDRLKDMILTAGYNVYPAEIERVISSHPQVTMVAIGKRPDEVKGEVAVAYIVAAPDSDLDATIISEYCRVHLAAYKRPREVVFVDALPTTSSGKLMRRKLTELDPTFTR